MTERDPRPIVEILNATQHECPRNEYSYSEKLLIGSSEFAAAIFHKIGSRSSRTNERSDTDIVYKHLTRNLIQVICAAFILIGATIALIFPSVSVLQSVKTSALNLNEAVNSLSSFYVYYSNEIFDDVSTFTTLSIGVIAGSISIATLGRGSQSQNASARVPYTDLINRFAFVFNGLFILFYASQILIWLGGFLLQNEICREEKQVAGNGLSYIKLEECGVSSPFIVIDSIMVILICAALHSLTLQSRRQSIDRIDYAYSRLLATADHIKRYSVPRRKFPVWNIVHLYTALSLLIFLFTAFTIELSGDPSSNIRWGAVTFGFYLMALILALFGYVFYPYMVSEIRSKRISRILRIALHIYISTAFTLSLSGALPDSASDKSYLLILGGSLIAFNAPLAINFIPQVSERIRQKELNEWFRLLFIRGNLVEKYRFLSRVE